MGYTPHVLIVGGGVLGTAIARDFAIRGLEVTLVEQGTLTAGTTGRMHGVLYSGARFAATDPAGAVRCRSETKALREIADHCLRSTSAVIADQSEGRIADCMAACENCGIPFQELSASQREEAGLTGEVEAAIRVPEAAVDPFELTLSTAAGAREYGAEIKTGAAVEEIRFDGGRVAGATVEYDPSPGAPPAPTEPATPDDGDGQPADATDGEADEESDHSEDTGSDRPEMPGSVQRSFPGASDDDEPDRGEREEIAADFVVNATGAWADRIAALAGIDLPLSRSRGRMLVLDEEPDHTVTQYDPEQPLSLSPFWGNGVVGPIRSGSAEDAIEAVSAISDGIDDPTVLRSYSGVWTQHASDSDDPYGPGATMIDHEKYDDQWGMLTVVGGTLTTHRLVAKQVVDRVCREFGIDRACLTDELQLPEVTAESTTESSQSLLARAGSVPKSVTDQPDPVLCESQSVGRETIETALESDDVRGTDLTDVRIRTGATMGACQGGRCGHRIATQLYPEHDPDTVEESLRELLAARWQGRRNPLWGPQLAAAIADYEYHAAVLNRNSSDTDGIELSAYDDGSDPGDRDRPLCCEAVVYG